MILQEIDSEPDPRLAVHCRELERRASAATIPEAVGATVPILLLETFEVWDVAIKDGKTGEPAVFQPSTGHVVVNALVFFARPIGEQLAVLAHEVAHALRHRAGLKDLFAEDAYTDLLACRLGAAAELADQRAAKHPAYAEALRIADPAEREEKAVQRHFQARAGIRVE